MRDEGIEEGLKVRQRAAGANMTVDIGAGVGFVQGDDQTEQGMYRVRVTTTESLGGFVAAATTQRIDLVCLRINDPNAGGPAGDTATLIRVAGAESGTPVAPAVPTSAIPLASVGPFTSSTSSITDAMIADLRALAGEKAVPGMLKLSASLRSVNGWRLCDGSAVSRTTFARLYDLLGTLWGAGDGSSTFNLPDYRGRALQGASNMGGTNVGNTTDRTNLGLGGYVGEVNHQLAVNELPHHVHTQNAHTHTAGSLSATTTGSTHAHAIPTRDFADSPHTHGDLDELAPASTAAGSATTRNTATNGLHTHTMTGSTGAPNVADTGGMAGATPDQAHNTVQPTGAAYVWIRT